MQHVNAVLKPGKLTATGWHVSQEPKIVSYSISDWCDNSTVASFSDGKELS